jgi:hypothetical protein
LARIGGAIAILREIAAHAAGATLVAFLLQVGFLLAMLRLPRRAALAGTIAVAVRALLMLAAARILLMLRLLLGLTLVRILVRH